MSRWFLSTALCVALGGCAHAPTALVTPSDMYKLVEYHGATEYYWVGSATLYENNDHLRQFYLVDNYPLPKNTSSRNTMLVDCRLAQIAGLERVYYPRPFAQGEEIARKHLESQWAPIGRYSRMGDLADVVCALDPQKLRAVSKVAQH